MSESASAICPSCGAPQRDRFCSTCGEKRITTRDYSVAHFAEHALETFTHFDFRSLRALKLLVLRPGLLTREYLDGRRKRYVGPVQLFVIMNVLFALLGPNTFRTPLFVQEHDAPFSAMKRAMVAEAMSYRTITREAFAAEFDRAAGLQGKTWIFSMIPAFAVCLAVVYGFRRYVFEHLVFATHFYAFTLAWMLVAGITLSSALRLAGVRLGYQAFDDVVRWLILVGLVIYLFFALRRCYLDGRLAAAARSLLLVTLFFPILLGYRFLLFFVTLQSMH